jgi:hypothetical protein
MPNPYPIPSTSISAHVEVSAHIELTFRQPLVTGTSVLGIKYKDGVMLAADNLGKLSCPMMNPRADEQHHTDHLLDSRIFRGCILLVITLSWPLLVT